MLNVADAKSWSNHAFIFALFGSVQSKGSTVGRLGTTVRGGNYQDPSFSAIADMQPAILARNPQSC